MCFKHLEVSHIMSCVSWYQGQALRFLIRSKDLPIYEIWDFKTCQSKIQESLNLIAEWMQTFFDHIFAYHDSPLPIGSDKIIKRLKMWLNNSQCGHKEVQKFTILMWDNHQSEFSHIYYIFSKYITYRRLFSNLL